MARFTPKFITFERYGALTNYDTGIKHKVWVNRGHEPANPFYEYIEIADTRGLPAIVGP
ncbi:hypothetical protein [Pseudodonghicola xiamenensis]|uniref:Uncharacterized protein n=1 Tax=Pseudodonghicola xiamenensis TaxID=337702 RepID=A0A8J3MD26_9RHOB|nr:hypothetical protein [Pseudodonghicola xiamenensis]GHG96015.1 hypothetical protein GCM10010961_30080 [Pseudodonghicola xiamenensis]